MKYSLYPGCSMERNSAAYLSSTLAIAKPLDIELVEIEDWNCCGATEYISLNKTAAFALIARNLAQAAKSQPKDLVAPCSACYLNLCKADKYLAEDAKLRQNVNTALSEAGLSYQPGTVRPRHLLDVIVNDIGYGRVQETVKKPLKGLRVAPYYGCFVVRPSFPQSWDNAEYPMSLDRLLTALGAEVIDFPMKAHCCGGHMTQISEATGMEMVRRLVKGAADYQADALVTLCPMCQLNLDAFQPAMNRFFHSNHRVPILFFTQLMGLAFGFDAAPLGFGSEFISAAPALQKIGVEVPAPAAETAPKKSRRDDKSLPMPKMG